jgi:hypothetical protein
MARRNWIPIVVGIVIFVVIVGIGLIGAFAYLVSRQVGVQQLSSSSGQAEFDRLREPFAGQQAFIELPAEASDADPIVHRELAVHPTGRVNTVHLRVWSPRDRKLVRVDFPMWVLRLMGNHPINLHSEGHGRGVSLHVTPEELDRRGPGLIMDYTSRGGEKILVWSE